MGLSELPIFSHSVADVTHYAVLLVLILLFAIAIALLPLIPKVLTAPGRSQLQETNRRLEAEIAERKRSEDALQQSEARYRAIVEDQAELICRFLPDGTLSFVNPAYCRYFGKQPDELIGHSFTPLIPEEDREIPSTYFAKLSQTNPVVTYRHRVILPNGEIRWQQWSDRAIYDDQGNLVEYQAVGRDITQQERSKIALEESEEKFRQLTEIIREVFWMTNADGSEVLYISPAYEQVFGRTPEYLYQNPLSWLDPVIPEDLERVKAFWETLPQDNFEIEYQIELPDGTRRWIWDRGRAIRNEDGVVYRLGGIIEDITERRLLEIRLQQTNQELEAKVQERTSALQDTVAQLQQEINERKQAEELFRQQTERERLLGLMTQRIRQSLELEAILNTTVAEVRQLLKTDRVVVYQFLNSDWQGQVIVEDVAHPWTSILAETSRDTCFPEKAAQQYEAGYIRAMNDVTRADLDECHVEFLQGLQVQANLIVPILVGTELWGLLIAHECRSTRIWQPWEMEFLQQLANQVAIAIQQSELLTQTRQQAEQLQQALRELQRTQLQLIQSEKMSSLGQLVAGVAHEINNPVNFVYGNLRYIQQYAQDLTEVLQLYQAEYPTPTPKLQQILAEKDLSFLMGDFPKILTSMQVGSDRIREIIKSLRNFSRLDEAEVKTVDIHEGLDSTLMILQHRLKANSDQDEIEVIRTYGDLPPVQCYPGQINQVFMNILSNAIDALDEQRQQSSTEAVKNCKICIQTEQVDTSNIAIRIRDNGPGISPQVQQRIFDPFFTTKPVGKGTGMGLAISYQIVTDKHQGQLKCATSPDKGTEFIIEIPIDQPTEPIS